MGHWPRSKELCSIHAHLAIQKTVETMNELFQELKTPKQFNAEICQMFKSSVLGGLS